MGAGEQVRGSLPEPSFASLSRLERIRAYVRGLMPATPIALLSLGVHRERERVWVIALQSSFDAMTDTQIMVRLHARAHATSSSASATACWSRACVRRPWTGERTAHYVA